MSSHYNCPKCDIKDIFYGPLEQSGDKMCCTAECRSCGWVGTKWYRLIFDRYVDEDYNIMKKRR